MLAVIQTTSNKELTSCMFTYRLCQAILCHSVTPEGFLISKIVAIPKANGKSVNDFDNHRGIALSSVLCKVMDGTMDHIILCRNQEFLMHVAISLASKLAVDDPALMCSK